LPFIFQILIINYAMPASMTILITLLYHRSDWKKSVVYEKSYCHRENRVMVQERTFTKDTLAGI
jgi:hypothetical protein